MFVRYTHISNGPGPSEAIIAVTTLDGTEEVIVDRDLLQESETLDVGSVIVDREDAYLFELPRETSTGRSRVWVAKSLALSNKVAA
ncbi:hypothetical protein GGQ73_004053 [Rhizobium skierniewicense]|uniref:Uncharacterized protein n=1 Tax=Rhizobium skierniewicense TaxID=984260 RepID=A0A7W6G3Z0_9HYPH|nr:hypothetical protein [Rhizobium skierniewicense]MBB3948079.1 hypothetical protein [Rhizobium skierniewicense]